MTNSAQESMYESTSKATKDLVKETMNESKNGYASGRNMLFRSPTDKMVAGVCGGLADYLGWDPVLVRILWIVVTLSTGGGGFLAYLALGLLLPVGTIAQGQERPAAIELNERNLSRVAYVLIGLGVLWLFSSVPFLSWIGGMVWGAIRLLFWPAVLMSIGFMLLSKGDKENWRQSFDGMTSRVRSSGHVSNGTNFKSSLSSARARLPLKRSSTNRVFMGVCGGIGERTGVDANLVRLLCGAVGIATFGFAIPAYILIGLLLPAETVNAAPFAEPQDVQVVEGTAETVL